MNDRMLPMIDGWSGPRCMGKFDPSLANTCGNCPARLKCSHGKSRFAKGVTCPKCGAHYQKEPALCNSCGQVMGGL